MDPEVAIDRINAAFGRHPGYRTLHAKGRFYQGNFTATEGAGLLCRAGHFRGDPVPVLVRFSNGGGNPRRSDEGQDVRGMAVSFKLPDGSATDLLGQTAPRFPVRTPEDFISLVEVGRKPYLLPLWLARHPNAVPAILANARAKALAPPHSYAEATYYPIHAYRWIAPNGLKSWVRYQLVPQASEPDRLPQTFSGKDRLREELAARLNRGPVRFTLEVQIAHGDDDPHDPMSVWGSEARHLDAGEIVVTGQAPDPEENGKVVVFDPSRIVDGIELSDDPILRYRPAAYSASVSRRVGP
jgi:catalase